MATLPASVGWYGDALIGDIISALLSRRGLTVYPPSEPPLASPPAPTAPSEVTCIMIE